MKEKYLSPDVDIVHFYPADGVLTNASVVEGFPVDSLDPGFTMGLFQAPTI